MDFIHVVEVMHSRELADIFILIQEIERGRYRDIEIKIEIDYIYIHIERKMIYR